MIFKNDLTSKNRINIVEIKMAIQKSTFVQKSCREMRFNTMGLVHLLYRWNTMIDRHTIVDTY